MDIAEIRDRYNNGYYKCQIEIPPRVKEDYVFDENLSVKRNREMVVEHNENVENLKMDKMRKQVELNRNFKDDVVAYIVDSYLINEKQARIVEMFVYEEKHSFMNDYFSWIDEVASMIEEIVEAKE